MDQGALLQDPFGLSGTLLDGQYRVDAVVGEGGFGVVYRGRHLSLDQPIAIKVLKGLDGGDARINALVLEKFRAEARLLYTLSQSSLHVVRSLDFGAATTPSGVWAPFMILEWLEGRSLDDDLAERRRRGARGRSLDEALAVLEPIVDGLAAAHRQKVAHRDVKPANVFLLASQAGRPGPRLKVLDFGIAKIMQEGESAGTKGTFASFTWLYAAPEQLEPRRGATGLATDVYALALVLTELLTDRSPVDDRDVVGIMKVATDPARRPTPRSRGANVPDEIEAVCERALAVDPRSRFASVVELWDALVAARASASAGKTVKPPAVAPSAVAPSPAVASRVPGARAPAPASSSLGARPPGLVTPAPVLASPPSTAPERRRPRARRSERRRRTARRSGTAPPGLRGAMVPYGASPPPPGTLPPERAPRRPFVRADGTSPVAVVTIVLFVLTLLFAFSYAIIQGACNAADAAHVPG
ncbi:MAG: protein kinase [Labilithrix sp.]|nr:protein kinase [Labilithrix sp.]